MFIPSYYNNGSVGGIVQAVYPSNGAVAWNFTTNNGVIDGSVALVPGAVLFGDANFKGHGDLYAVSTSSGNTLFYYKLPEAYSFCRSFMVI